MQNRQTISSIAAALAFAAALASPAFALDVKPAEIAGAGPIVKTENQLDDAAITAKVKAALVADKSLSALDIKVTTRGGQVTLSGSVNNAQASERALQVVAQVEGVKGVQDDLQVKTN
ncbi:BON domain-containing protein [Chitinimonas sp. BJB300]|uniref:BON domain-containing protein n=1 Tax=Chitinimonas sp. BJB300 TaxID=1559339 RepID=UPI000C0FD9CD|nr:BON domain-containing protein [Chitinimonas sp. BJB300]PHV12245.1 hydrogenase [Chitinimonas sp. BJB300]TSJ84757.1 BON domain-containing protein [Chitinimonas sp. BJB300]